jgi:hypothetical protein
MNKAQEVSKVMNEVGSGMGTDATSPSKPEYKPGVNVMYKKGTPFAGLVARIANLYDNGTCDLKLGKGYRVAVPLGDLDLVSGGEPGYDAGHSGTV